MLDIADLLARDNDVRVLVPGDGPLVAELRRRGIETEIEPTIFVLRKETLHPRRWASALFGVLRSIRALRAAVLEFSATRVYVNTITLPTAVLGARLARRPAILHVHEAETSSPRAVQKALLAPLLLCSRVIVISDAVGEFVSGNWQRLGPRTYVARNPTRFPATPFPPLPANRPERLEVIAVGRWSPRKGTDLAVKACAQARQQGVDLHLTLVGSAFAGYEWFEAEVRDLASIQLPDTTFVGFTANPDDLWARAHITVVPSRIEPYGLVAAESMVRGRVTIAADVDGLPEIVTDGVTGRLVAPDADAFAAALTSISSDWTGATALAERGLDRASTWTLDAFGERIQSILKLDQDPGNEAFGV